MSWPTLTRRPRSEQHMQQENVVKHGTESGAILRRRKFTRERFDISLEYDLMPNSDATYIKTLFNTNNMHSSFTFVDKNSVSRTMLFNSPIKFVEPITGWTQFDTFELTEV